MEMAHGDDEEDDRGKSLDLGSWCIAKSFFFSLSTPSGGERLSSLSSTSPPLAISTPVSYDIVLLQTAPPPEGDGMQLMYVSEMGGPPSAPGLSGLVDPWINYLGQTWMPYLWVVSLGLGQVQRYFSLG